MSSDHSSSLIESLKDEESPRPHTPSLALAELAGSEPAQTQERPLFRRAKFALARKFPGTYRVTSKALLYLRGPRPKRDLDRGSRLQHPIVRRSNPFANSGTCSTNTFPVFGVALQSWNATTCPGTCVDQAHTNLHPSLPLHPRRRRIHHRSLTLHSSAVVPNTSRHIRRMYRYLLVSQQQVWPERSGLSTLGIRAIRFQVSRSVRRHFAESQDGWKRETGICSSYRGRWRCEWNVSWR